MHEGLILLTGCFGGGGLLLLGCELCCLHLGFVVVGLLLHLDHVSNALHFSILGRFVRINEDHVGGFLHILYTYVEVDLLHAERGIQQSQLEETLTAR